MNSQNSAVLVVDLDGTLLRTDLLWEALTELARRKPWLLLAVPLILLRGRVALKQWLSHHVHMDFSSFPLNESVANFVRTAKEAGTTTILATAAFSPWAEAIAQKLGWFDHVLATEPHGINLSGTAKLQRIVNTCNGKQFDYIGDRGVDIPIWQAARRSYIVGKPARYEQRIGRSFDGVFKRPSATVRDWLRLLRIEQWTKNLLVFVPLLLAHRISDIEALSATAIAGAVLSLLASGLYIVNDLLDLPADRKHPTKRYRPIAQGRITLQRAWIIGVCLIGTAGVTSAMLPITVATLLLGYALGSLAYSLVLKHYPGIDITILALLYTLRVVIGGVAGSIELSSWLLGFSFLFFSSLALLKRHSELVYLRNHTQLGSLLHRPYTVTDEPLLLAMGIATAIVSLVVLILYLTSERARLLYAYPDVLWLVLPLLLYWIARMWHWSIHGKLAGDPLSVALRDWQSLAIAGALVALILLTAR